MNAVLALMTVLMVLAVWAVLALQSSESAGHPSNVPSATWDSSTEVVIVTAHFNEDLEWLRDSHAPVVVCDKPGASPMPFQPDAKCSLAVNRGREASSFLKFIIEYYDRLPRYVAFLHGHKTAAHQRLPFTLLEAIKRARRNDFDYISLNNELNSKIITEDLAVQTAKTTGHAERMETNHPAHEAMKRVWDAKLRPIFGTPFPEHLRFMCCAQFIVSRAAILRRPKSTYQQLYDFLMDPKNDQGPVTMFGATYDSDWTLSVIMEFVWHMLFGEAADRCQGVPKGQCSEEHYLATRFRQ